MSKKILVIPSIREDSLKDFFVAWKDHGDWDKVILIEDNPQKTFQVAVDYHYSWNEIEQVLGVNSWIVSKQDSAIRCFGFLIAAREGADYVLTLDDDVRPHDNTPIFARHIDVMNNHPRWTSSIPDMRTRGFPYKNLGKLDNVNLSMGTWSGVPDLDAIQSLNDLCFATNGKFQPPNGSRIIPYGQFTQVCGMNLCFKSNIIPLMYFPLQGQNQPFSRFDDIFCGIICKKVLDHLRWHISVGEPHVRHIRASDVMINLVKEAPGIKFNETFWEIIDDVLLTAHTPIDCMKELGNALEREQDGYIHTLGRAIQVWSYLF